MQLNRPLLTIAIPTYNRSSFLAELLEGLLPELNAQPDADLVISDNCSTDDTEAMVESLRRRGLRFEYVRNQVNIGSDNNFLQCFHLAQSRYVWVLGDDDVLMPGAIPQLMSLLRQGEHAGGYDLVYLSSFGFSGTYQPPPEPELRDKFGRFAEVVTDGNYFLEKVNALIGLISVNIINKDRLLQTNYPPIEQLNGSNLMQVGWLFPVLHRRCRILYIWQRLLGYRRFNSGGWGVCEVFGVRMHHIAARYFAYEPSLERSLMNGVLHYWLPSVIAEMRRGQQSEMKGEDFARTLYPLFRANWRYWIFVYAVSVWPMWLVGPTDSLIKFTNRMTRATQALYRHSFCRGNYLRP